ncbi:hypothetical protein ACNQF7_10345 [Flavobacterium sp. RSP29]|uniref:hypothetical protein n=1 Tax=Flavobacterium sp. RSP29 TaxID=3401731 RepID=UPI003AAC8113
MNTIQNRILQYLEFKGITAYRFCKDLGMSMGYLDKKGAIGTDKYLKIIEYYSDISPEWLLTGKGEMLKNPEEKQLEPSNFKEQLDDKTKIIKFQDKQIEELEKKIVKLKKEKSASEYNLHVAEPSEKLKKEPKK